MKISIRKGVGFGLTSGVIATLGMLIGLHSATSSRTLVIGGILIIAISDALSDALGIHISEEAEFKHTEKSIWESTIATFFTKLIIALSFVIPFLLFPLFTGVIASIIWGFFLITLFSYYLAKKQKMKPFKVIFEHAIIAGIVIVITHYLGIFVSTFA